MWELWTSIRSYISIFKFALLEINVSSMHQHLNSTSYAAAQHKFKTFS